MVKKAFIVGHQEAEFKHIVNRISSIFFLATPHQGAAIAQTLTRLIALFGSRPFVDDLLPQSTMLQSINEDFPRFCESVQLLSFYETRPMSVGVNKMLIVDKASAVTNLANERRTLLDADHRNVAMYSSSNDSAFVAVRNALATVISAQRTSSVSQKQALAVEDQTAINLFMGVSDAPEDDIMTQDSVRLPGSCEWLMSNTHYRSWREARDRFLWLRGRPGAGKSVLAGHVVNDLRSTGLDCCFFFCQSVDNTRSSANTCLRSLAWQMSTLHSDVSARLREIVADADNRDGPLDKTDLNPIWRRVFLSGILKVRLTKPQYWVIDAMDECKGSMDLMNFLARIQEHWPVSILVTCRDPVETHLSNSNLRLDICSYTITEEDSNQDISLFLRSNMEHLPCPTSHKWDSPLSMASQIVSNSGGCFLWASLIYTELRTVSRARDVDIVLQSVPSDMNALYSKILDDMGGARFGKDLAKSFITWATYAFRPLTTAEIQEPIELDINDKIDDVERAISRCCGNIVYVDSQSKVRLVHSTAREFLTNKETRSEFAVSKAEGHRRLVMVCLRYLIEMDKLSSKTRRLGSEPDIRMLRTPSTGSSSRKKRLGSDPNIQAAHSSYSARESFSSASPPPQNFVHYASTYLFQHLNQVHSTDEEVLLLLSQFLSNTSVLRWIEFIAGNGDLHVIYNAGKTINSLLSRRAHHSPPLGLAHGHKKFALLSTLR